MVPAVQVNQRDSEIVPKFNTFSQGAHQTAKVIRLFELSLADLHYITEISPYSAQKTTTYTTLPGEKSV